MRIIPAIDIIDGHPVRLSEGDYSRKTSYRLSALEAAKAFEDGGLTHLHLVDLDAAAGRGSNIHVLEEIAEKTSLSVDFGGGIRTEESVRCAFDAGASAVNVGSAAAKNPEMVCGWNDLYPGRIILSADARDGKVKTGQHYSGNTGNHYFDSYCNTRTDRGILITLYYTGRQTVTGIPNGTYTLQCAARTSGEGAFITARTATQDLKKEITKYGVEGNDAGPIWENAAAGSAEKNANGGKGFG